MTTASPSCQRNALPNLVWSTESTVSQRNASLQAEPSGEGSLQDDAQEPGDDEPEREAGQDAVEARPELESRRAKDECERGRAADNEQDQREVEGPHELEESVDRAGRALRRRPARTRRRRSPT